MCWYKQVPPLLQESQDPAWRGLQQDLQIMNEKDAGMAQPGFTVGPVRDGTAVAGTWDYCEGHTHKLHASSGQ